jgi:hypothetical protein
MLENISCNTSTLIGLTGHKKSYSSSAGNDYRVGGVFSITMQDINIKTVSEEQFLRLMNPKQANAETRCRI